jgi:hypothetical protein
MMLFRLEKLFGAVCTVSRGTLTSTTRSPEYHSAPEFSRPHKTNLYGHYQRPGHWQ